MLPLPGDILRAINPVELSAKAIVVRGAGPRANATSRRPTATIGGAVSSAVLINGTGSLPFSMAISRGPFEDSAEMIMRPSGRYAMTSVRTLGKLAIRSALSDVIDRRTISAGRSVTLAYTLPSGPVSRYQMMELVVNSVRPRERASLGKETTRVSDPEGSAAITDFPSLVTVHAVGVACSCGGNNRFASPVARSSSSKWNDSSTLFNLPNTA